MGAQEALSLLLCRGSWDTWSGLGPWPRTPVGDLQRSRAALLTSTHISRGPAVTQGRSLMPSDAWVFTAWWRRWKNGTKESRFKGGAGKRGKRLDTRVEPPEMAQERHGARAGASPHALGERASPDRASPRALPPPPALCTKDTGEVEAQAEEREAMGRQGCSLRLPSLSGASMRCPL